MPPKPPSDWRAKVRGEVAGMRRTSARRGQQVSRLTIEIPPGRLIELLRLAAERRRTSVTGYIRRAMLAYLAWDLQLDYRSVVRTDPRFSPPDSRQVMHDPDGVMGGPWEIS